MAQKKIVYVITKSSWGGAQRYVFDLATALPVESFSKTVVTGDSGMLTKKLKAAGVKVITLPPLQQNSGFFNAVFSAKNVKTVLSLAKILKDEQPDIVHLNSSKIGGLGAVAARLSGVPKIIFTAHGWGFHEERPKWQLAVLLLLSKLAGRLQHHIIHVAKHDLASTLAHRVISSDKASHIPLGVRESAANFSREEARSFLRMKCGIEDQPGTLWVGTIAELTKNKGLDNLIKATDILMKSKIKNLKLQIVIVGDGEDRNKLQNLIMALGLQNTVKLAGFIPEAARYLGAFDLFVLSSLKEGLPYSILEAVSSGVPVVASRIGGIPDIIEHNKSGLLVPAGDAAALSSAIAGLLVSPLKRKRFADEAKKKLFSLFSFPEMVRRHAELYLA